VVTEPGAPFAAERQFFLDFAERLTAAPELQAEVVGAIADILARYNTTIPENRFIVGGVIEQILGSAPRAAGLSVTNVAKTQHGHDLVLGPGAGLSVKAHLAPSGGSVTLINTRGASEDAVWKTATLFVVREVGIGYADPVLLPGKAVRTSDSINLSLSALLALWKPVPELFADIPNSPQQWLVSMPIPTKPEVTTRRVVSDREAHDIFMGGYPSLLKHWQAEG
jgi:hypothetical protein